ncbi:MAG: 50S ribosomal protein L31e [Candidatus Pacearchaeota archaeon]
MAEKQESNKLEREYVINLRRGISTVPYYLRAKKAIRVVKEFLVRHMKIRDRDLKKVKIDRYLNEFLWARGIRNPMTRIKIKAVKEGDIVRVELAELPKNLKFKKIKEERLEQKGAEAASKKKKGKEQTPETKPEEKTAEEVTEEKEKMAATVEAGKEMEKAAQKMAKHETKTSKQPKRPVRQALQK